MQKSSLPEHICHVFKKHPTFGGESADLFTRGRTMEGQ